MKKPAASTVKARAVREKRLEDGMAKVVQPTGALVPAGAVKPAAKAKASGEAQGRVIYIGHIPHGFYEEQMRGFFSQFGEVTRVRLSRNKKTGHSKHFAWVEFKHSSVAKIAAEAMDNYLLYGQVLKVKVVPPSALHPDTLKGANTRFVPRVSCRRARAAHDAPRDAEATAKQAGKLLRGEAARRKKIAAAGIEYEFGGYGAQKEASGPQPAKKAAKTDKKTAAGGTQSPPVPAAEAAPEVAQPRLKRKAAAPPQPPALDAPKPAATRAKAAAAAAAAPTAVKKRRKA